MVNIKRINEQRIYSNYTRNLKFLGIIDYKSLTVVIIYIVLILNIMRILPINAEFAIYGFISLVVPIVAIFCVNLNNESTVDVICIILDFYTKRKIYADTDNIRYFKPDIYVNRNKNM